MVKEAEENAEVDKTRKEEADLRNESEQIIFAAKKSVDDLGAEVSDSEKKDIESKSEALRHALEGKDLDVIRTKKEDLLKVSQKIATRAYEKAQKEHQAHDNEDHSHDDNQKPNDEKVVDAEFEDVD
jgi:molecular chaperone DnaK